MVKKTLLLILVNCILLHSSIQLTQNKVWAVGEATPAATESALVQVSELPTVHILPDNPLYFLKTLKEKIQLTITRSSSGQADLLLSFAQKRLTEALGVTEKGKIHISEKLFAAFGQDVEAAQKKIEEAQRQGEQTRDLLLKLQRTIDYQQAALEEMQEKVQERSEEVRTRTEALNDLLVRLDQSLVEASDSGKMGTRLGTRLGIGDWLKGLFGKKEILSPLVR